jgi:hypothetical protein
VNLMKRRVTIRRLREEKGSISILTIGLFLVSVALLIVITDIASISVSRASLVNASEAAAITASHRVDLGSYYRGNSGVTIPIDCQAAYQKAIEEIGLWSHSDGSMYRPEVQEIWMTDFSCSGNRVQLSTSARALLPFRLPQSASYVEIHATVEAESDRVR